MMSLNHTVADRVSSAFAAAEAASKIAYQDHLKTWPLHADGTSRDGCGYAGVVVHATRQLKAELVRVGRGRTRRGLHLSIMGMGAPEQGITAQERCAQAGCDVLNELIGDLGKFRMESRMD